MLHPFQHGSDTAQHHRCCLNDLNNLADDQESLLVLSVSVTLQVTLQVVTYKGGRMVPTQTAAQLMWSMVLNDLGSPSLATQKYPKV